MKKILSGFHVLLLPCIWWCTGTASFSCSPGPEPPALSMRDSCEFCDDGTTCFEGICVDEARVCGKSLCDPPRICVDGECKRLLTLATYNLYDLVLPGSTAGVARYIAGSDIDLILFQEIQPEDAAGLVQALADEGVEMYHAFSSRGGYGGDRGNDYLAVFSRFPLTGHETILGGTLRDPVTGVSFSFVYMRPVHRVVLTVHDRELVIYNLHLKAQVPFPDCGDCLARRRAQAAALETYILENDVPELDHVIVAGDVNSALAADFEPGNTLDLLTLRSDNPENTGNDFTPVNYLYRNESTHLDFNSLLDHLILSPALMPHYLPDSVRVIAPAGKPSDHKSVLLQLVF